MSWSARFEGVEAAEDLDPEKAINLTPSDLETWGTKSTRDFDSARDAAAIIVEQGSLGEGLFNISVSGHHDPHQDGPNDFITVTVHREA